MITINILLVKKNFHKTFIFNFFYFSSWDNFFARLHRKGGSSEKNYSILQLFSVHILKAQRSLLTSSIVFFCAFACVKAAHRMLKKLTLGRFFKINNQLLLKRRFCFNCKIISLQVHLSLLNLLG